MTPWTVALQASMSMGFSRQEYWSGLPFHLPGDLPDPGIQPVSLLSPALAGGFFTLSHQGSPSLDLALSFFLFPGKKPGVTWNSMLRFSERSHPCAVHCLMPQNS